MHMNYTLPLLSTLVATLLAPSALFAQDDRRRRARDARTPDQEAAPIPTPTTERRARRTDPRPAIDNPNERTFELPTAFRSIDGFGNHEEFPSRGAAHTPLIRMTPVAYTDGVASPAGEHRESARVISNACVTQNDLVANAREATDFLWQWGQFLDHDIDLTHAATPAEPFDIPVPNGDASFDPSQSGTVVIPLNRSESAIDADGVRQQLNGITAFIDASNVYGSDAARAEALRTLDGTGRLKTSPGDLLPFNTEGLANAPSATAPTFFLAGDERANEQVGLTAMHTLFVREHNYWVGILAREDQSLSGEERYQFARMILAAEMQAITYREFLPVLLGRDALPPYRGYDSEVDPSIANSFSTAAFRLGHSMLSPTLLRLDRNGSESPFGHLSLAQAFFSPSLITDQGGIDPILRGLASQMCQEIDNKVVDAVRNFLFGAPGSGGFDLASLNIQRGRDHGLADYNTTRQAYGLPPARRFRDINPDRSVQDDLQDVYDSVNDVDLWVGGLAEAHVPGAMVGPTYHAILTDQFQRLRDGDRFWYQHYLPENLQALIEDQTLATIIRRNTGIGDELPNNVFRLQDNS